VSLDPNDDDAWLDEMDDDDPCFADDFPLLSDYALDIVRVAGVLIGGVIASRVARYIWAFLRFVVPV
jgi:hypothetical protein